LPSVAMMASTMRRTSASPAVLITFRSDPAET
jgi:hypothetical protein